MDMPVFVPPMAMQKMGHPDGEVAMMKAALHFNVPYVRPPSSSMSFHRPTRIPIPAPQCRRLARGLCVPAGGLLHGHHFHAGNGGHGHEAPVVAALPLQVGKAPPHSAPAARLTVQPVSAPTLRHAAMCATLQGQERRAGHGDRG